MRELKYKIMITAKIKICYMKRENEKKKKKIEEKSLL